MDSIKSKSFLWGLFKSESKPATPSKASDNGIIMQLAKEFTDRSRASIKNWRDYMQVAENPENPRWYLLQDMYDNMRTDGHLTAVMNIRKAATMSTRFFIKDKTTGEEIPEKTELLKTEWFYQVMEEVLDSIFFKYTLLEYTDPVLYKWTRVPRRNIIPQRNMVVFEVAGDKGINYTDPGFAKNMLFHQSNNEQFGLFNVIMSQLIWKRNAQQTWVDFCERFGIPLITATTTRTDKASLDRAEAGIKKLGQAMQALLPEGTTIDIHDSVTKGDPYKVFSELIKLANDEISKAIVGGTMVTDNGSSKSQSEVHERTLDDKIAESDRRMIEFFVNGKLIPFLNQWGFGFGENEVFAFDRSEQISMVDHWTIVEGVLQNFEADETVIKWVANRFGIPISKAKAIATPPKEGLKKPASSFSANFR